MVARASRQSQADCSSQALMIGPQIIRSVAVVVRSTHVGVLQKVFMLGGSAALA